MTLPPPESEEEELEVDESLRLIVPRPGVVDGSCEPLEEATADAVRSLVAVLASTALLPSSPLLFIVIVERADGPG